MSFADNDDGMAGMGYAALDALEKAREAFAGAAEEAGFATEDDVIGFVKLVRWERAVESPAIVTPSEYVERYVVEKRSEQQPAGD